MNKQQGLIIACLGVVGLLVTTPVPVIAQQSPPVSTSESAELAEAKKLNQQIIQLYGQGKYAAAIPLAERALAIRKKILGNEHADVAGSLNNLAGLYSSQGRYRDAEPLYKQALDMTKRLFKGDHPDVAQSLNNLAGLYESQGRYTEAEPLYKQALEMIKRLFKGDHPNVALFLNNLAALYSSQGKINQALELLTEGIKIQESNLTSNLVSGFERQKREYLATISGTTDATISLHLNSAPNNSQATRLALSTILQRKGRILDFLTNTQGILRQRLDDAESKKILDDLSQAYTQLSNLIYNPPKEPSPEYRNEVAKLEKEAQELQVKLSSRSQEFRTLSQPVTVETIQKLIPADKALVEIVRYKPFNLKAKPQELFGEPRYAAYILSSQGEPKGIDLGEAEKIERVLDNFRRSLRDSGTGIAQVKESGRELDKIVMQPIRKYLGNTRKILISPDSNLNLIPFEALVDENNQYLVEKYAFTYLTSGRDLIRLQNPSPSQQPPVIIADPIFDLPGELTASTPKPDNNSSNQDIKRSIDLSQEYFPPLKGTRAEAETIALQLKVKPLLGKAATEGVVKQIQAPKILHIATHGFFKNKRQTQENQLNKNTLDHNPLLLSGLVLAGVQQQQSGGENGILSALETSTLNLLGTKLVVLSACDTGLGRISSGEGIYNLRRALVIAGSESQIISLWQVEDNGTKDLMKDYYQRLLDSTTKTGRSEALRQTQLKMLRGEMIQGEKYQHPYYWAAFIPSGEWKSMEE